MPLVDLTIEELSMLDTQVKRRIARARDVRMVVKWDALRLKLKRAKENNP